MSLRVQHALMRALGPDPFKDENAMAESLATQTWMRERRAERAKRKAKREAPVS